jgi:heterodisulfide reductase subunit A-like polyferredoxin
MEAYQATTNKPVGKKGVVVIGGGIAGIQAALDLARAGAEAYLVEKSPAVGGRMAQLDKTLPTNDCSICILSPFLVECARHERIHLLTLAEVEGISGSAGDFTVQVLQHPRYIDTDRCTGCSDCEKVCPVEINSRFECGLSSHKAIYRAYPQAVPNVYAIMKGDEPPCNAACPAGINVQGYVALVAIGKYEEAYRLIKEAMPFPSVCGRVCYAPCEEACNRKSIDQSIAIRALKRFVSDLASRTEATRDSREPGQTGKIRREAPVAVIGSGPAGLTAAWKLAGRGYPVTVFESLRLAGGMLRVGIPRYRLPADILDQEIQAICDEGVEIRCGQRIDDIPSLIKNGYRAVCVAVGAHRSPGVGLPGEDLEGAVHALEFLRRTSLDGNERLGGRVVVIGGGNAAIDAARTALRLGGDSVQIAYRRSRDEMPAYPQEVEAALKEGIGIIFQAAPVEIIGKVGKVSGIRMIRTQLGEPDDSGRRSPIPVEGSEFDIEADLVILAISQQPDTEWLSGKARIARDGTIEVDPVTLETGLERVFAAGDAVSGPATVVEAIGTGLQAAESIHRYLSGIPLREGREPYEHKLADTPPYCFPPAARCQAPEISSQERTRSFDEVELRFPEETAVTEAKRCMACGICCSCMECVQACEADAIRHDDEPARFEIKAAAVIVATGFDEMDPRPIRNLGYGDFEDVLTGLEFERMLNASGPTGGKIMRRSDGRTPRSIAFVQCVGSRDERYNPYCSRVCCMYSVKQCIVAKEHESSISDFYYFYRDMRAYGRGFEEFYLRAKNETGIRFVKSSPSSISRNGDGRLSLHYEDPKTARPSSVEAEMVVLSCAMKPSEGTDTLSQALGIELDTDGFFKITDPLSCPVTSTRGGIFISGCASGPKDIPDSVAQASAASAKALSLLEERTLPEEKPLPQNDPTEEPRIGVFVCHCGLNIGRVVDSKQVAAYAGGLPGVVYAADNLYTCSDDTQKRIAETIKERGLNRVVVAACTPRTHEPIFRQTCAEAGLNPYLFEMANIRDQCSWVHSDLPQDATEKAKDLVRMAVARAKLLVPLERKRVDVERSVLVIGGGIAGIQCAIDTARLGIDTHIIERESRLGGQLRNLNSLFPSGRSALELLEEKIQELRSLPVKIHLDTSIDSIEGFIGNFTVKINGNELTAGAIVLATGGIGREPEGKLAYGKLRNVKTSIEFEKALQETTSFNRGKQVVFIQCVGAREPEGYTGCSRYCCQVTLKQACEAARKGATVTVVHRDIRAFTRYGEDLYRQARLSGVRFVRQGEDSQIKIQGDGHVEALGVYDETLASDLTLPCDLAVLAVPMVPAAATEDLSETLRIPLGSDGFFLEKHVKLGPLETNTEGIFLCGCAQYPKDIPDSLAQASGVAAKVGILLARPYVTLDPTTAVIRTEMCRACGTCVEICEYNALSIVEEEGRKYAAVNEALCKGCGACAPHCPTGAIVARHFTDRQIETMIDSLLLRKAEHDQEIEKEG